MGAKHLSSIVAEQRLAPSIIRTRNANHKFQLPKITSICIYIFEEGKKRRRSNQKSYILSTELRGPSRVVQLGKPSFLGTFKSP